MGMLIKCGKERRNIKIIIDYIKYKLKFGQDYPDYFIADGLLCFVGPQGSGKTLSAVNYVCNLMALYPKAKLVTNLYINDYPICEFYDYVNDHKKTFDDLGITEFIEFDNNNLAYQMYLNENRIFRFHDNDDFGRYHNDEKGMIFLVDEIQLYLNSLESKNINMDTMTEISQQRKQRVHIVCTSQVFGRMAKPLREQFSNVIVCKNYLGFIQMNSLVDRDSLDSESSSSTDIEGKVKKNFMWFHNPKMYKRYDTYYKIKRGKFTSGEKQNKGVYEDARTIRLSSNN